MTGTHWSLSYNTDVQYNLHTAKGSVRNYTSQDAGYSWAPSATLFFVSSSSVAPISHYRGNLKADSRRNRPSFTAIYKILFFSCDFRPIHHRRRISNQNFFEIFFLNVKIFQFHNTILSTRKLLKQIFKKKFKHKNQIFWDFYFFQTKKTFFSKQKSSLKIYFDMNKFLKNNFKMKIL